jgi:predicted phage tail protein
MLVTLNFHPILQPYTNGVKSHAIEINKLSEIIDAVVVLFPKLRRYIGLIKTKNYNKENLTLIKSDFTTVTKKEYEFNLIKDTNLTLCPIIGGGGKVIMPLLMIVAAVALIYFAGPIAGSALGAALGATQAGIISAGVSMVLSNLMGLIGALMTPSSPSTNSSSQRRGNDMFDTFENSTDPNTAVALIYGRTRVSGQLLSGHLETITHGEADTIYVSDVFNSYADNLLRQEGGI